MDTFFYKKLDQLFLRLGDGSRRSRGLLEASNTRTLLLAAELIKYNGGVLDALFEVITEKTW